MFSSSVFCQSKSPFVPKQASANSRVAAKFFVFVISWDFQFFVKRNISKHEIEIWAKISQFRKTRNQNVGNIVAILQERYDFLN